MRYVKVGKRSKVNLRLLNPKTRRGELEKGLMRKLRQIEKERGVKILKEG